MELDWSAKGMARVYALTVLGTVACIAFAFGFDSYSWDTGGWRRGTDPLNNLVIPLLLAPPFFFVLLAKMRQLAIAHTELMTVAATDSLTSLLNRRAFTEMVDGYLKRVEDSAVRSRGALLAIDVDHFKQVNDRFGHDSGDAALKLIANTIDACVRETDLVGRMGGEEFCVFIPGHSHEQVSVIAERIRAAVSSAPFTPDGRPCQLSVSVGGVVFEEEASFCDLYRSADERLYSAKRNGRNRVELASLNAAAQAQPAMH